MVVGADERKQARQTNPAPTAVLGSFLSNGISVFDKWLASIDASSVKRLQGAYSMVCDWTQQVNRVPKGRGEEQNITAVGRPGRPRRNQHLAGVRADSRIHRGRPNDCRGHGRSGERLGCARGRVCRTSFYLFLFFSSRSLAEQTSPHTSAPMSSARSSFQGIPPWKPMHLAHTPQTHNSPRYRSH